jgi:uncharacterized protein YoxC
MHSQAIGVLNQVATTLTGIAVAFFGGVAILMRPMQSDISSLKKDVDTLKKDVETLKTDVGSLKKDVETLKTDVGQIKSSQNVSVLLSVAGFVSLGVLMVSRSP